MNARSAFVGALLGCVLCGAAAWAQQGIGLPTQRNGKPIEIDADAGIEWHQKTQQYIARGNARASQGDVSVRGDTLVAYYRKSAKGKSEIFRIDANGNVRIESPTQTAYADKGIYMVEDGVMVLTGKDVRLVTPTDRITARDSLEYWEKKNLAVARGDAVISRDDKRLRADVLAAHLLKDPSGKTQISQINAFDNVLVSSAKEIVQADKGVYDVPTGIAKLSGSVRITRDGNQLNGEFAEVNLKTGVSRLYSGKGGRVQGLIKPQDAKMDRSKNATK